MANQTVYPYGQGGQLPSGYPIADDLKTNSAQQALSAKQGLVLNEKVETQVPIDLSTMGRLIGTLSGSGTWYVNQTKYQSVQVPVVPGQIYRIVGNSSDYVFYAFFSALSFPVNNGTPSYASGYNNRLPIEAGITVDITIPEGTNYLYFTVLNNNVSKEPQSISLLSEKTTIIKEDSDNGVKSLFGGEVSVEFCNYATDSFTFTGSSAQGKIEKVGGSGYLITNTQSTANRFLYKLPNGLVDGEEYYVSFDYKSWLSSDWWLLVNENDGSTNAPPNRGVSIPSSGEGKLWFLFRYQNGDTYLRLASSGQNAGCSLLIENLSIVSNFVPADIIAFRMGMVESGYRYGSFLPYYGRKIDLTEREYHYDVWMNNLSGHQSSACYGDYMVTFSDKMATIKLYNLRTKSLLATVTQSELDSYHHCNEAFFGTERYDENDTFPLVYISVKNDWEVEGGKMEAWRIIPTMGSSDYTSFTITLVQTVTVPKRTDANALAEVNFVQDTRSGLLYTYSRNAAENNIRITQWKMPTLADGDVTLPEPNARDSWDTKLPFGAAQGAAIKNHLLFFFRGSTLATYIDLFVIDLVERKVVAAIDLLKDGFTNEPEGVFFWGNTLYTSTNGVNLYRFLFR